MIGKHSFSSYSSLHVTSILTTKNVKNWTLSGPGEERLPSLPDDPSDSSKVSYFITVAKIYLTYLLTYAM